MAKQYFVLCFIVCFNPLHVASKTENDCVNIAPTYFYNETMFVIGEIGKQLTVFCDVNESCKETSLKTCFLEINNYSFPLKPTGSKKYIFTSGIVTENLMDGYICCTYMSKLGENVSGSMLLIVNKPYQNPILKIREPLFLDESEHIECILQGSAFPKPDLKFYINDKEVDYVAQPCDTISGCIKRGHITGLKREWHGGKIKCCISGLFFKQMCSALKVLKLQFPPLHINIAHEVLSTSTSNAVVKFTCDVIAARPACNVVWEHEGNVTGKGHSVTQEREDGMYTTANIVLSLQIHPQEIVCKPICLLYNKTDEERLHVYMYHISNYTTDYGSYSLDYERTTGGLIVVILFSVFGNVFLGVYLFATSRKQQKNKNQNSREKSLPAFGTKTIPSIKERKRTKSKTNSLQKKMLYKRYIVEENGKLYVTALVICLSFCLLVSQFSRQI